MDRAPESPFVAVVTGASSGIGAATARRLAREPGAALVLIARRQAQLDSLADELGGATVIAADLTDADAPARIAEVVEREYGALHLLVNNAGAAWRGRFADGGWENVRRHMELNFDAPVRLTEALLPLLRRTAAGAQPQRDGPRVAIVNVSSTSARVSRANSGGWSDSLHLEEQSYGIHVGLVLPGFVATEGFPQAELVGRAATRWIVSRPELVAEAILDAGPGGRSERYVPRAYWLAAAARILMPGVVRRATRGGGLMTPTASE